ncbi:MAG TPA: hypothetical protein VFK85_00055 [Anaeromyxobacteraceae bacterium]|nr:hypothetical protein [Anaeromyxobacteraceae bacterium]
MALRSLMHVVRRRSSTAALRRGIPLIGAAAALPLVAAVAVLALSCTRAEQSRPAGLGKPIASGAVVAVKASPSGAFVAWLGACSKVTSGIVALGTQSCELRVAPTGGAATGNGGEGLLVAKGVTTLPHGFVWADGQTLLALESYEHAAGEGTLVVWDGSTRRLADKVRFYAATPDGQRVGWVANGVLSVLDRAGDREPVVMGDDVATFEFGPPSTAPMVLLARRQSSAGGDLLVLAAGKLTPVATRTAEYRFSPAGDFAYTVREGATDALTFARASAPKAAVPVRRNVHSFTFAPDGSAIAFVADVAPGRQGDLWVARVAGEGARPGAPEKVASGVGEVRWAPRGGALAWLAEFEPGMRSGALTVRPAPGAAPVQLASKVSAYEFSPDGGAVAFLEHVVQGGYSVDLRLARLGADPRAETVARGVFGFDFAPEGDFLYFRDACVQNGESCDLERIPAAGLAPGAKPERLAQAVKSFDFDRRNAERLLLAVQPPGGKPVGISVWRAGKLTDVDRGFVPGTGTFLAPDSSRLVYAVQEKGREGVYLAELK